MKLDNERNIRICQKALYSKQLECYANLCKLYSELAKLHSPKTTAEEIQKIYAKPLSSASKGDLNFNRFGNYNPIELAIFQKYAEYSKEFNEFTTASKLLSEVLVDE